MSLYLGTHFILVRVLIVRDEGSSIYEARSACCGVRHSNDACMTCVILRWISVFDKCPTNISTRVNNVSKQQY
jgi:hypothetical protein